MLALRLLQKSAAIWTKKFATAAGDGMNPGKWHTGDK